MKKKVATAVVTVAILSGAYAGMASANTYTVQKGDTLSKIAIQYQTSVRDLKQWNGLTSDLIYINQTLKVASAAEPAPTIPTVSVTEYNVVSGDYLGKIAKQFGTTVQELKSLNGLVSDLIYVGQVLKVSAATPVAPPPEPVVPTPAPPAPPIPTPSAPASEYIIKSGDTLSKIGLLYSMTVLELKTLNGLKSDLIYVGQKLIVSGAGSAPPPQLTDFAVTFTNTAKSLIGTPYVWGGSTLSGFDCSGFIHYVANKSGKSIGRYSAEGYYSRTYYVDQPQPGDLVFFQNTYKPGISHVGIYLGDNQFIHADEKKGVSIASLGNPYYTEHLDGFKRFY